MLSISRTAASELDNVISFRNPLHGTRGSHVGFTEAKRLETTLVKCPQCLSVFKMAAESEARQPCIQEYIADFD